MNTMLFLRYPNFSRFGIVASPTQLIWTRRWHRPGAFELHIPFREGIEFNQILSKGIEAGVVDGIVVETTEKDGDALEITGSFLATYAKRRIVWGTQTIDGTPEYVMKQLAERNMGSAAAAARQFAGFTVEGDQGFTGSISYQKTDVPLDEELEALSISSGLGYDIKLNGLGMQFRVLQGIDRTSSQSVNPRAIFSIERRNLLSAEYEIDGQKFTNVAKVSNSLYTEVFGTATGYERHEVFVAPTNVEKDEDGVTNNEATQRALLLQQGEQKLTPMTLSFTVRVDPNGNLKYKEHYDLGDICTCQVKRWYVSLDARITEIKEIYDVDGEGLEITFGTGQLSYGKNIRRIVNV